jgi:hypothetical protein
MSKAEGIKTVYGGGGHVVILGAGASIASTVRNKERNNKILPSMDNFIDVVGLRDLTDKLPKRLQHANFEKLYSLLHKSDPSSDIILNIEDRVLNYFKGMELPSEPTIYDYLVMSLRQKDLIATFNWDPFLIQAIQRNSHIAEMPNIAFLHGNVAVGYNFALKRFGPAGFTHRKTMTDYEPTRLLFPVTQKNYNLDEFTFKQWEIIKHWLGSDDTKRITFFGYGAPATDVEAVKLLSDAWGSPGERNMEQVEIIDVRPEDEVREQWDKFIHSHHYDYATNYFESILSYHPRRSSESWFHYYMPTSPAESFMESNKVPQDFKTLKEMWDWYRPLIDAENEWQSKQDER